MPQDVDRQGQAGDGASASHVAALSANEITPEMIEAGIDAYFGLCDQDWEDDHRSCVAEIIRAAFAVRP